MRSGSVWAFGVAGAALLGSCHKTPKAQPDCASTVDRTQLAQVVKCFYSLTLSGRGYELLSEDSKKEIQPDVYRVITRGIARTTSGMHGEVISEADRNDKHYARVSVTMDRSSPSCVEVMTHTWVREAGAWGYVASWGEIHEVNELRKANKQKEALAVVDRWMAREPFSTEARQYEMDIVGKLGADAPPERRDLKQNFVQTVLPMNPKDTSSLHFILQHSTNSDGVRALFELLPPNACGRDEAAYKVASELRDPKEALTFLDSVHSEDSAVLLARVEVLAKLGKTDEAAAIVNPSTEPGLKKVIQRMPGAVAAVAAARVGAVLAAAGRPKDSAEWMSLGATRDPKNRVINALKDALKDQPQ